MFVLRIISLDVFISLYCGVDGIQFRLIIQFHLVIQFQSYFQIYSYWYLYFNLQSYNYATTILFSILQIPLNIALSNTFKLCLCLMCMIDRG